MRPRRRMLGVTASALQPWLARLTRITLVASRPRYCGSCGRSTCALFTRRAIGRATCCSLRSLAVHWCRWTASWRCSTATCHDVLLTQRRKRLAPRRPLLLLLLRLMVHLQRRLHGSPDHQESASNEVVFRAVRALQQHQLLCRHHPYLCRAVPTARSGARRRRCRAGWRFCGFLCHCLTVLMVTRRTPSMPPLRPTRKMTRVHRLRMLLLSTARVCTMHASTGSTSIACSNAPRLPHPRMLLTELSHFQVAPVVLPLRWRWLIGSSSCGLHATC